MSGLRDRIAAALRAHDYWDGCTDRRCVLAPDCEGCLHRSNEMADAALEAAAPQIAAAALREAADGIDLSPSYPTPGLSELHNAESAAEAFLRARANEMEAGRG